MANDASITLEATVLPDRIAKVISGSMSLEPADANHKWYHKLTSVTNSSNDLIGGHYLSYTALADSAAPETVATTDTVAFLLIKNHDTNNRSIYLNIANGTAAAATGNIYIGAGETWYARLTTTTVAHIHAISSASTVECTVIALLDDTSV